MATITVSYDGVQLTLSDNGHTNASHSEQIHWHPGSGVRSVTNVVMKPTSPVKTAEFWSDAPQSKWSEF